MASSQNSSYYGSHLLDQLKYKYGESYSAVRSQYGSLLKGPSWKDCEKISHLINNKDARSCERNGLNNTFLPTRDSANRTDDNDDDEAYDVDEFYNSIVIPTIVKQSKPCMMPPDFTAEQETLKLCEENRHCMHNQLTFLSRLSADNENRRKEMSAKEAKQKLFEKSNQFKTKKKETELLDAHNNHQQQLNCVDAEVSIIGGGLTTTEKQTSEVPLADLPNGALSEINNTTNYATDYSPKTTLSQSTDILTTTNFDNTTQLAPKTTLTYGQNVEKNDRLVALYGSSVSDGTVARTVASDQTVRNASAEENGLINGDKINVNGGFHVNCVEEKRPISTAVVCERETSEMRSTESRGDKDRLQNSASSNVAFVGSRVWWGLDTKGGAASTKINYSEFEADTTPFDTVAIESVNDKKELELIFAMNNITKAGENQTQRQHQFNHTAANTVRLGNEVANSNEATARVFANGSAGSVSNNTAVEPFYHSISNNQISTIANPTCNYSNNPSHFSHMSPYSHTQDKNRYQSTHETTNVRHPSQIPHENSSHTAHRFGHFDHLMSTQHSATQHSQPSLSINPNHFKTMSSHQGQGELPNNNYQHLNSNLNPITASTVSSTLLAPSTNGTAYSASHLTYNTGHFSAYLPMKRTNYQYPSTAVSHSQQQQQQPLSTSPVFPSSKSATATSSNYSYTNSHKLFSPPILSSSNITPAQLDSSNVFSQSEPISASSYSSSVVPNHVSPSISLNSTGTATAAFPNQNSVPKSSDVLGSLVGLKSAKSVGDLTSLVAPSFYSDDRKNEYNVYLPMSSYSAMKK